jgi:hypothetical protein
MNGPINGLRRSVGIQNFPLFGYCRDFIFLLQTVEPNSNLFFSLLDSHNHRITGLVVLYVASKFTDEDRANSAYWQQAHGKGGHGHH